MRKTIAVCVIIIIGSGGYEMPSDKSEAQLKNEAEVKRIMAERGYSCKSSKKDVKKTFGSGVSPAPFIVGFIVIALIVGCIWFFQNHSFGEEESSSFAGLSSDYSQDYINFQACIGSIDTSEIAIDDGEFWNKHIERYEKTISCYDSYPSVASLHEKEEFENALAELRENASKSEASDIAYRQAIAENERQHQERIDQINADLAKNLAEIEESGKEWDEELARRVKEREAEAEQRRAEYQKQQSAYEQQKAASEAAKQQQEQAAKAKCEEFLATYGDKTPAEIAESDSEVKSAKNIYSRKSEAYGNARSSYYSSISAAALSESQRASRKEKVDAAESEMRAAESAYKSILNQKTAYYRNLKNTSCGS